LCNLSLTNIRVNIFDEDSNKFFTYFPYTFNNQKRSIMIMEKKIIYTEKAPRAIGPYSQAVVYNGTVYCSGQIALLPESMEIVNGGIEEQARQVMKNLEQVLIAAETSFKNVLKCTIFLQDMNDFPAVNEIYGEFFEDNPPSRETVAVKELPKSVLIEVSCVAAC